MSNPLARPAAWEFITPALPDTLEDLGNGHYVAKWWKPVPPDQVQMLLQIEGIRILRGPYEPENLPEGLAVRFSIEHEVAADELAYVDGEGFMVESRGRSPLALQKTAS